MSIVVLVLTGMAVGGVAFGLLGWAVQREGRAKPVNEKSAPEVPARNPNSVNSFQFRDDVEAVRITINDREFFGMSIVMVEQNPLDLRRSLNIDGSFHIDHRRPYFDGNIKASLRTVEIRQNRITKLPEGWDENFNDRAYEVVNDHLRVVFQIALESAEHVNIDAGQWINNDHQWRERLFRYPSSKYPRQTVDGVNFHPLSAKTLYEFFLTDCKSRSSRTSRNLANQFRVERIICRNLDAKSSYLSVFVPRGITSPGIEALASEYLAILEEEDRAGFGAGTVFTGRIFIYHEGLLPADRKTELESLLKKTGADPRFFGPEEVIKRNSPLYEQ